MRKHYLLAASVLLVIGTACNGIADDVNHPNPAEVQSVTMMMSPFVDEVGTKVNISIDEGGRRNMTWENSDEVGIFPDLGGYQLGFSLKGQGGKTVASFDGGGWALLSTAKYSAYFPFEFNNRDYEHIPVDYCGQVQNGFSSTAHLGPYTFCASEPTSAVNGRVSFALDQVGSLVWFKLTLPDATTYTEISLVTDDNLFVTEGEYSLADKSHELEATHKSAKVTLELQNVTTTTENQHLDAFMMVAPTDLTGHSYKLYVKSQGGLYYSDDLASKNHVFEAGAFKGITSSPVLSDGYNIGVKDWVKGDEIKGQVE